MTEELPSDWHIAEALRRENPDWSAKEVAANAAHTKQNPSWFSSTIAHARTLAEFLKEPVDPLLVMAREICAKVPDAQGYDLTADRYRNGKFDNDPEVQFALECLRKAKAGDV